MRVLITGSGIAGPTLAILLAHQKHTVTVLERTPTLRASGLQVDLRGHGVEVLRRMGLKEAFLAKKAPEQGIEVVDKHGNRKGYFPSNSLSPQSGGGKARAQNFTSDYEIMRGDLVQLLFDAAVRAGVVFVFGKYVTAFVDGDDGVKVTFSDGRTDKYDLLVGADGQRSSTRRSLFGQAIEDACYDPFKDTYMAYFTIPRPIQPGEGYVGTIYVATNRRGIMTRRHSKDELQVYIGCNTRDGRLEGARHKGDVSEQKKIWAEIFKGAGWRAEELMQELKETESDIYVETPAVVKLERWSKGRVVLLGDAAWCPTPTTGVGTTCAMIGAYVLAGEIARHCGVGNGFRESGLAAALKGYEDKFMPYMTEIQRGVSTENGGDSLVGKGMATSLGISLFHLAVSVASALKLNLGRWFLKEDVLEGWDLDEYKAVEGMDLA